jgi:hypothetical protein
MALLPEVVPPTPRAAGRASTGGLTRAGSLEERSAGGSAQCGLPGLRDLIAAGGTQAPAGRPRKMTTATTTTASGRDELVNGPARGAIGAAPRSARGYASGDNGYLAWLFPLIRQWPRSANGGHVPACNEYLRGPPAGLRAEDERAAADWHHRWMACPQWASGHCDRGRAFRLILPSCHVAGATAQIPAPSREYPMGRESTAYRPGPSPLALMSMRRQPGTQAQKS